MPCPSISSLHRVLRASAWLGVLSVSILWLAACGTDESRLASFLERGDAYLEEEKYNEAIIEYRNAIQVDPNHARAHYALAQTYLRARNFKEAYWELHESKRLDPANLPARMSFGQLSLAARDFEAALEEADRVLEAEAENATALVLRGRALEGLERNEEAEEAYLKGREVAPEDASAHLLNLAQFYQRRANDGAAEPLLREWVESDSGYASQTALARFLARNRNRDSEAEATFRTALASASEDEQVGAYRNLAGFFFNRNRFDEAEEVLETAIEAIKDEIDLIYLLARFHRSRGNQTKANELMEEATRADPTDPLPFLVLSAYRGSQRDLDGALAAVDEALAIEPGQLRARLRKAELLVEIGFRDQEEVKLAQGRSIVEAALAREPSNPEALFVRAKIELAEEQPDAAIATMRSAIDARPSWAQAYFVLGSALMLQGHHRDARAALARAVELDAGLLEARRLLAQVHSALGEDEYAVEQGRIFLRERPDHTGTHILVAQSLARLGRRDEALQEIQSIPAEKRDAETLYALGRLQVGQGDLSEARELILRANELRPNHPDILRTLLGVERRMGRTAESITRIDAAVRIEPDDPYLLILQGAVKMLIGDEGGAERTFRAATEIAPDNLAAYEQLAYFYRVTGRLDDTIRTYEKAVEVDPESARLQHFLGVLYEYDGQTDRAIEHYGRAVERDRSMVGSLNNLAYLLADSGTDLDRALDLAQQAKALLPDSAHTADTLGWVLFKRGTPSAAIGYLREAEEGMDPSDDSLGIIRHHLAQAYEADGDSEKAIASLARAMAQLERREGQQGSGKAEDEPDWATEVRAMLERLQGSSAG